MHPSVQDIQRLPEFPIYVDYMRKVLGELLDWSREDVDALVANNLRNSGFRTFFMHDPWSQEVASLIVRDKIPERMKELAGKPLVQLVQRLEDAIDTSPDAFNTNLHHDGHYDWGAARRRIQQILNEYAKIA